MAYDLPRDYPWYAVVSGSSLAQGDILLDCPVFNLPQEAEAASAEEFTIRVDSTDAIVMTQSCDFDIGLRPADALRRMSCSAASTLRTS